MSSFPLTPPATSPLASPDVDNGGAPLRRFRVLQALWLALVLIDLAMLVVSLPVYYHTLFTLCPGPVTLCPDTNQLNVHMLLVLQRAGFSLNIYACYVLLLDALTTVSFLLIGALLIWQWGSAWMGLFVSFLLIEFGSLGLLFAHISWLQNVSSNPLLHLLSIATIVPTFLYYPCLSFFFSVFPDGRFVPRRSWALIGLWAVNAFFWVAPPNTVFKLINWPPLLEAGWLSVVFGGSACLQLYRFLHAASPIQCQQIKWLLYGFVPVIVLPLRLTLYMTFVPSLNKPGAYLINTPDSFSLLYWHCTVTPPAVGH